MAERKISRKITISCLLTFLIAFVLGVIWQRYYSIEQLLLKLGVRKVEYSDISSRVEVPNKILKKPFVIVIAGQSNVANSASSKVATDSPIFNLYDGKVYKAESPLLGNTGLGGSPWLLAAEKIIDSTHYEQVLLVPIARSNSSVLDWAENGIFSELIDEAVQEVNINGLQVDLIVWGQGERDSIDKLSSMRYQRNLAQIFERLFQTSDMSQGLISLSSRCFQFEPNDEIRTAQKAVIDEFEKIFMGPDTDVLGANYRFDGCHFNQSGQHELAQQWASKIIELIKLQEMH